MPKSEAAGARVTGRANGEVGANPFARQIAPLTRYWMERDFEAGLKNLRVHTEVRR